jgi:hypothetical protein
MINIEIIRRNIGFHSSADTIVIEDGGPAESQPPNVRIGSRNLILKGWISIECLTNGLSTCPKRSSIGILNHNHYTSRIDRFFRNPNIWFTFKILSKSQHSQSSILRNADSPSRYAKISTFTHFIRMFQDHRYHFWSMSNHLTFEESRSVM